MITVKVRKLELYLQLWRRIKRFVHLKLRWHWEKHGRGGFYSMI